MAFGSSQSGFGHKSCRYFETAKQFVNEVAGIPQQASCIATRCCQRGGHTVAIAILALRAAHASRKLPSSQPLRQALGRLSCRLPIISQECIVGKAQPAGSLCYSAGLISQKVTDSTPSGPESRAIDCLNGRLCCVTCSFVAPKTVSYCVHTGVD